MDDLKAYEGGKKYTPEQIDGLLNLYFRNHRRSPAMMTLANALGIEDPTPIQRLIWGLITGYGHPSKDDPKVRTRRKYTPTEGRVVRDKWPWYEREDKALLDALDGAGQDRQPPCDVDYVAEILARDVEEVCDRYEELKKDPLGRDGFGFGG